MEEALKNYQLSLSFIIPYLKPGLKHEEYSIGENQTHLNSLRSINVLSENECNWKANVKKTNSILKPRKVAIFHSDKNLSRRKFPGLSKMLQ